MAVPIQFYSIVTPVKVVQDKYNGGLRSYKADCPNKSYNDDGELACIGFMDSVSLYKHIQLLVANGFLYQEDKHFSPDFTVIQYLQGMSWQVPWVKYSDDGQAHYLNNQLLT